jgi:hypothetical protein
MLLSANQINRNEKEGTNDRRNERTNGGVCLEHDDRRAKRKKKLRFVIVTNFLSGGGTIEPGLVLRDLRDNLERLRIFSSLDGGLGWLSRREDNPSSSIERFWLCRSIDTRLLNAQKFKIKTIKTIRKF